MTAAVSSSGVRERPAHERRRAVVERLPAAEVHRAVLRHQNLPPAVRALAVRVGDVHRAEARPRVRQSTAVFVVRPALLAAQRRRAGVRHHVRVALHGQALSTSGQQTPIAVQLEHD